MDAPAACVYEGVHSRIPCKGRVVEVAIDELGKAAMLCSAHRRCGFCEREMWPGHIALGTTHAACISPPLAPHVDPGCVFRCSQCSHLQHYSCCAHLVIVYDRGVMILYCDLCYDRCHLCGDTGLGQKYTFGSRQHFVCRKCIAYDAIDPKHAVVTAASVRPTQF